MMMVIEPVRKGFRDSRDTGDTLSIGVGPLRFHRGREFALGR
jgi:hypothetical protein